MKRILMAILAALGICTSCSASDVNELSPQQFNDAVNTDSMAVVIDVRKPSEYAEGHLKNAQLLDFLDEAAFDEGIKKLDKTKHYYIYCRSGRRSHNAADKMQKLRLTVYDMSGGILNWNRQGLPTTTE